MSDWQKQVKENLKQELLRVQSPSASIPQAISEQEETQIPASPVPNINFQPPRWFELFQGQGLPHDREGGWRIIQREMCPTMAAMSLALGRAYCTADTIKLAFSDLKAGTLTCECCFENLSKSHRDDCELMKAALKVINGRPGTFDGQSNSDKDWFQRTYSRLPYF